MSNNVQQTIYQTKERMQDEVTLSIGEIKHILEMSRDEVEAERILNIICNAYAYGYAKGLKASGK